jgi:hypothetical protein
MNDGEFDTLLHDRLDSIISVLSRKRDEYQRGEDYLHAFKRGATLYRETPERYCLNLLGKHFISLIDLVQDLDSGKVANPAVWDEKIGDVINYLILLEALTHERA